MEEGESRKGERELARERERRENLFYTLIYLFFFFLLRIYLIAGYRFKNKKVLELYVKISIFAKKFSLSLPKYT